MQRLSDDRGQHPDLLQHLSRAEDARCKCSRTNGTAPRGRGIANGQVCTGVVPTMIDDRQDNLHTQPSSSPSPHHHRRQHRHCRSPSTVPAVRVVILCYFLFFVDKAVAV
ncbi:hypothetical protein C0Q70_10471 [Pomacea canaliculata]|uniref:Uncharacterized protein n=1 Tax=Pomacea canaliculata TaxID=400727 RepID=A0A2T7P3B4_POMCA|nr:hypothetical protein C0Q70_10471 [Pomacea canaliculata]